MPWPLLPLLALLALPGRAEPSPGAARVAAQPGLDGPGRWLGVGEAVGPATVVRVETHPEFERLHLEAPGQSLPPVEVVEEKGGRAGICSHHGLTLFPRWELVGPVPEDPWHEGERPPATVEEQVHAALCARLDERGEGLRLGPTITAATPGSMPSADGGGPGAERLGIPQAPVGYLRGVGAAVVALTVGLALAGARRLDRPGWRDLALVAGLSALARFGLASPVVFNGGLAGYEKLVMAMGLSSSPDLYGQGWPTVMAPAVSLLGAEPATVFLANRLLATVAPVALWAALRPASPAAARVAGLSLAALPLAVLLAPTEEMSVPTLALALVGAAAAAHADRGLSGLAAGALAGLAAGLACHVRPEGLLLLPAVAAVPFALRGRAALRDGGPWLALLLGGALVLLRLAELPPVRDDGPLVPSKILQPGFLPMALLPAWESRRHPIHLFMDAAWTSPLLWVGVALALASARRAWRPLAPWVLWVLGTGVLLAKSWPLADAWRLQLLAMPGWLALAAWGLAPRLSRPALLAAAVGLVGLPLAWQRLDFARHAEWRWLARVVPTLPQGPALRYDDGSRAELQDKARDMAVVLSTLRPGLVQVAASSAPPQTGQLVLLGLTCFESEVTVERGEVRARRPADGCPQAAAACTLVPVDEVWVPARSDLDGRIDPAWVEDGRLRLGIYRLEGCAEPAGSSGATLSAPPSAP
ncbi:glycosyltransferase family 39 protein [Myxococcota bacterium]|nr:glycosyltransferase family 39 protein [Myxococcota bacterium]